MDNSIISPKAKIDESVQIGPFCYISDQVEIGEGTWIGPHVTIYDYVKIGKNCKIFPGAVIGAIPQDLKFAGEVSYVEIGDNTTIREYATINRGTAASGKGTTKIGNNSLIMSYCHVAHDCKIGDHCIMTSYAGLAGETDIDDWAIIGGGTLAHQFSKIGAHAMIGGCCAIAKDVPPFILAARVPLAYEGINIVGLRRRGFSNEDIEIIGKIYDIIYKSGYNVTDALKIVEECYPGNVHAKTIVDFIRNSKRGIVK
ncbi:MAG: acyl-ACP--UDP-N-acetylglucosamine O-acyltransferase [Bacteroidales bacterium]|nr:acyl-ACP--UDP-N-acetylglucosamine O-acyltransferase [Bacteroidales bacterium]